MKPIMKTLAAGAATAAGSHLGDQYFVESPPSEKVYYGIAIGAAVGAYVMRKKPVALGALAGLALGAAYSGYSRGAEKAAVPPPKPTLTAPGYQYGYPPPQAPAYPYPYGSPYYPPPTQAPSPPSLGDAQKYLQQGSEIAKTFEGWFGGTVPEAVPWETPGISDDDFYGSY